jgi:hypothetical protein
MSTPLLFQFFNRVRTIISDKPELCRYALEQYSGLFQESLQCTTNPSTNGSAQCDLAFVPNTEVATGL